MVQLDKYPVFIDSGAISFHLFTITLACQLHHTAVEIPKQVAVVKMVGAVDALLKLKKRNLYLSEEGVGGVQKLQWMNAVNR